MKKKLLLGSALAAAVGFCWRGSRTTAGRGHRCSAGIRISRPRNITSCAAWQEAETARTDNHDELGGHAEKALEHLQAADRELKEAAEYANAHHH